MSRVKKGTAYIEVWEKTDPTRFTATLVGRTMQDKPFTAVRTFYNKQAVADFVKEVRAAGKRKGISNIPVRKKKT